MPVIRHLGPACAGSPRPPLPRRHCCNQHLLECGLSPGSTLPAHVESWGAWAVAVQQPQTPQRRPRSGLDGLAHSRAGTFGGSKGSTGAHKTQSKMSKGETLHTLRSPQSVGYTPTIATLSGPVA
eukprot:291713-Chlamydomonas_euryale.AAC.4